jgi:hypothetical protein
MPDRERVEPDLVRGRAAHDGQYEILSSQYEQPFLDQPRDPAFAEVMPQRADMRSARGSKQIAIGASQAEFMFGVSHLSGFDLRRGACENHPPVAALDPDALTDVCKGFVPCTHVLDPAGVEILNESPRQTGGPSQEPPLDDRIQRQEVERGPGDETLEFAGSEPSPGLVHLTLEVGVLFAPAMDRRLQGLVPAGVQLREGR